MSILINKDTRVLTQGITGKTGMFHTKMGKEYANGANCYVAGVTPKKGGQNYEGIPIFDTVAEAQKADAEFKHCFKRNAVIDKGLEIKLVENTKCVCKEGRLVIPKPLQRRAVMWYHHYLQHPGHTRLEETINAAMYWKGMRTTIRSITKSCKTLCGQEPQSLDK